MPAIAVEDITVLPRIPTPDPMIASQRAVQRITTAPRGFEGKASRCGAPSPASN